ncbi:MAG: hypothetical protein IJS61_11640 [Firmicutes bacterium]|nr:hypothetical protein [Bacillota bacterium]
MTIIEASKQWGMKSETIFKHIEKGEIGNLCICNNQIILPDIPKPYFQKNNTTIDVYRTILTAAKKNLYLDNLILHIPLDAFRAYVYNLIDSGYFKKINPTTEILSSQDYIITLKISKTFNSKIQLSEKIHINFGLNINL